MFRVNVLKLLYECLLRFSFVNSMDSRNPHQQALVEHVRTTRLSKALSWVMKLHGELTPDRVARILESCLQACIGGVVA